MKPLGGIAPGKERGCTPGSEGLGAGGLDPGSGGGGAGV